MLGFTRLDILVSKCDCGGDKLGKGGDYSNLGSSDLSSTRKSGDSSWRESVHKAGRGYWVGRSELSQPTLNSDAVGMPSAYQMSGF